MRKPDSKVPYEKEDEAGGQRKRGKTESSGIFGKAINSLDAQ